MKKKNKRAMVAYYSDILFNTFRNIDMAHFIPLDTKLQKLVVGIDPVQDLHGYDNPWPAGGGKNIFNSSLFDTDVGALLTYISYAVPNGVYTMSSPDFPAATVGNVFFITGAVTTGAGAGTNEVYFNNPRTITVTDGYYTVAYRNYFPSNQNNPADFNWQIEAGSTPTAWMPYSNECPITGHSSVNVIVSTSTNPLDGTITNIPLGGTYYQGQLDVITGLLTITHEKITRSVCSGVSATNAGCFYIITANPILKLQGLVKSNYLLTANAGGNMPFQPFFSTTQAGGAATTIWCRLDDTYITKSDVDTYLTSNPLELLYQLNTPQTIQLTPQQINTIVGSWNYVWCDSGKIIEIEA